MTSDRLFAPEKLEMSASGLEAQQTNLNNTASSDVTDLSSEGNSNRLDGTGLPPITFEGGPIGKRKSQFSPGAGSSGGSIKSSASINDDSSHQRSFSSMSGGGSYHARRSARRSNSIGSGSCGSRSSLGSHLSSGDRQHYVTIFFASQSGTSAYYAAQLQREGTEMGFDVGLRSVRSLSNLLEGDPNPTQQLRRVLVPHKTKRGKQRGRTVFVVSTYHEGGPSDDAKRFVELLKSLTPNPCLKGLRYAVIGLGDSGYSQTYNMQAKFYDETFEKLGGKRMMPPGLCDQAKDLDMEIETVKWRHFWPALAELSTKDSFMPPSSSASVDTGQSTKEVRKRRKSVERRRSSSLIADPEGGFVLEIVKDSDPPQVEDFLGPLHSSSRHFVKGVECSVKNVEPLWVDPALDQQQGKVVRVDFDLTPSDGIEPLRYETGDNVAVLPINKLDLVEAVAEHLDYGLDTTFVLVPKNKEEVFEPPFPSPCTVRDYLSHNCELSTPPRRSVLRALSRFATLARDRDELHRISSVSSYSEFNTRITKQNIGIGALLTDYFPSIRVPLVNFIRLCTPLQPRWYSVSSSPSVNPNALTITFSVISIPRTIDNSVCLGACSHYLADLAPAAGDTCRIIKMGSSGFVVPPQPSTPVIMVCNGTGLAPMRALLQELHYRKTVIGEAVGPILLFYGIRRTDQDFLYKDEIKSYQQDGTLTELHLACSREQAEKIYVQHVLAKKSDRIWELLQCGAHIYVCGANTMTSDVDAVLRSVVTSHLAPIEATQFVDMMEKDNRYIREGWSSKNEA